MYMYVYVCVCECEREFILPIFVGANLKAAIFDNSQMNGVNLRLASLRGSSLRSCNLRYAIMAGTDMEVRNAIKVASPPGHSQLLSF